MAYAANVISTTHVLQTDDGHAYAELDVLVTVDWDRLGADYTVEAFDLSGKLYQVPVEWEQPILAAIDADHLAEAERAARRGAYAYSREMARAS